MLSLKSFLQFLWAGENPTLGHIYIAWNSFGYLKKSSLQ